MGELKTHKDLDVWKKSVDFVVLVYDLTKTFPKDELYGIVQQIRRSAVSISSNIAEGAARKNYKEFIQFLHISLGSLAELETQVIISQRLNFVSEIQIERFNQEIIKIRSMLLGLIRYLKKQDTQK